MPTFQELTYTLNRDATVRREVLDGREHLVAPVVLMTEGVHEGNVGPVFYPAEELSKWAMSWNHKPIVVYHPDIDGKPCSACEPAVLNARKVGVVLNTQWDGDAKKLRGEAWLDVARVQEVDARVYTAVTANQVMEVSTGLFTENEQKRGVWNGEGYHAIARSHRPDHLALLPDLVGACSVADGAGLLQLNQSYRDTLSALSAALEKRWGYVYVLDAWDDKVVYERGDQLYSLGYKYEKGTVTLSDDAPQEVYREVAYRATADSALVGNAVAYKLITRKEEEMTKKQLVDGLIANATTKWGEDDRPWLMTQNASTLEKLVPLEAQAGDEEEDDEEEDDEDTSAQDDTPPVGESTPDKQRAVQNAARRGAAGTRPAKPAPAPQSAKPATLDEYINNAPPELRESLMAQKRAHDRERAALIDVIVTNERNKFTKPQLEQMTIEQLDGLAALARKDDAPQSSRNYYGAQGAVPEPVTNERKPKPLGLPTTMAAK